MSWEQRNSAFCEAHTDAQLVYIEAECEVVRLEAENAKLRELVRIMAYCMQYERECDECKMNGADGNIAEPVGCVGLLCRLHELGVEA